MLCEKCKSKNLVHQFGAADDGEVLDVNVVVEWKKLGQKAKKKFIADTAFCSICGSGAGDNDGAAFIKGFKAAASLISNDKLEFWLSREADMNYFIKEGIIEVVRHDYDTQQTLYRVK